MNKQIRRHLRHYYFGVMPSSSFEKWLYADKIAESQLGQATYLNLIDADYSSKNGREIALGTITEVYPGGLDGLQDDHAREIARDARSGKLKLDTACRILAELECSGAKAVPVTFDFLVDTIDRGADPRTLKVEIIEALDKLLSGLGEECSQEDAVLEKEKVSKLSD